MSTSYDTNSAAEIQIEKEIQDQILRKSFLDEEKKKRGQLKMKLYQEFTLGLFCGLILNFVGILISFCVKSRHFKEGIVTGFIYFIFFAILSAIGYGLHIYEFLN